MTLYIFKWLLDFESHLSRPSKVIKKFFHSFLLVILVWFFYTEIYYFFVFYYTVWSVDPVLFQMTIQYTNTIYWTVALFPGDLSYTTSFICLGLWFIIYYFLYLSGSVSEHSRGFSGGTSGKEPADQCRRHKRRWFDPWIGKIHWRRSWQPTPVYLPRASSWTEEPGGLQSRVAQGQTLLKQLSMHACRTLSSVPFICIFIYGLVPQCFNYWGFIMCSHIWAFITHRWTYFSSFQNFPGYPTPVSNINLNIILST